MPTPFETLYNELAFSLLAGKPETPVRTPGYPQKQNTVEYVIDDRMASEGWGKSFAALLRIVAQAAAGKPVQEAARAWIDEQAAVHAAFHADDLAEQMVDEDADADAWYDRQREAA